MTVIPTKARGERTLADLMAERESLGGTYAATVEKLRATIVDLALVERRIYAIAGGEMDEDARRLLTFSGSVPDELPTLRHRDFLPNPPSKLRARIEAGEAVAEALQ